MAGKYRKKKYPPGITLCKNGRLRARYLPRHGALKGKTQSHYFDELIDAENWLMDWKNRDRDAVDEVREVLDIPELTMDELFDIWIEKKRNKDLRYNSIRIYTERYKNRIKPFLGKKLVSSIQPYHIDALWEKTIKRGDSIDCLNKIRYLLKNMFKYARVRRIIKTNPMDELELELPRREKKEVDPMDRAEQKLFMEKARESVHYDAFVLMLNTGIRYGELAGLRWSDIDWNARTLSVNRTVYYKQAEKVFDHNPPKTKKGKRTIPLNPLAYETLLKIKNEPHKCIAMTEFARVGTIFLTKEGLPTLDAVYNRSLAAIKRRMNYNKQLSCHVLRHTFATRCIECGINPKTLQLWLGHSDVSLTMNRYVHVTFEESEKEMLKFVLCS